MAAKKPAKKRTRPHTRARSAVTGEWATKAAAKAKPREHVRERVERVVARGWVVRMKDGALWPDGDSITVWKRKPAAGMRVITDETIERVRIVSEER